MSTPVVSVRPCGRGGPGENLYGSFIRVPAPKICCNLGLIVSTGSQRGPTVQIPAPAMSRCELVCVLGAAGPYDANVWFRAPMPAESDPVEFFFSLSR